MKSTPGHTLLLIVALFFCQVTKAADPTATNFSETDCLGSAKPYPVPAIAWEMPDSLTPVFINHVGRHGARYLSSVKIPYELNRMLEHADSAGGLSPAGKKLRALNEAVVEASHNRWGALDSLGMAEQRGIASRMFRSYPKLFVGGSVNAISSYSPRCVMSMYEFTHQLSRLDNKIELHTSSGPQTSGLMRPFEVDGDYVKWSRSKPWEEPYNMFFETTAPASAGRRLLENGQALSTAEAQRLAWNAYKLVAGLPAMGWNVSLSEYFTAEEQNALWACENLGHYLRRTATTLSPEPAYVAVELLRNIISTTKAAMEGKNSANAELRFGHAETLMPLYSLMRMPGGFYLTNYFDTVALHWHDFHLVPMAANLQLILSRNKDGKFYVCSLLNEMPVALLPGNDSNIVPANELLDYLTACIPFWNE